METIADQIRAWASKNISNSGVMTRQTDCYNHMQAALGELLSMPWASQPASPVADAIATKKIPPIA